MAQDPLSAMLAWLKSQPGVVDQMQASSARFKDVAKNQGLAAAMRDPVHDRMGQEVAGSFDFTGGLGLGGMAGIIRAYHGSPHTFDKFDISKLGTGEGAQAYGHGLYFAENPAIAQHYLDALSTTTKAHNTYMDRKLTPAYIKELAASQDKTVADFFKYARPADVKTSKNISEALQAKIDAHQADIEKYTQRIAQHEANPPVASTYGPDDFRQFIAGSQKQIDQLQRIQSGLDYKPTQKNGSYYAVDLDVNPEDLLHWDKPLAEQPEKVRTALAGAGVGQMLERAGYSGGLDYKGKIDGRKLYERLALQAGGPNGADAVAAAQALRDAGIPGIRYLDGGSRDAGEGTANIVMFSHDPVKIVERNGKPVQGLGLGK